MTNSKTKPFLKWAGGKSQLLDELIKYLPTNYQKYIEPFVGAGALFFTIDVRRNRIISDINEELINSYKVIQKNVDELIDDLQTHTNDKKYFYEIRSKSLDNLNNVERASRFIYLNKTCFNGLHRVNKKGEFNVPYGYRKNPKICDNFVLKQAHKKLQNVIIENKNYIDVLSEYAEEGDFIFLDPPYHPVGKYSDFKRYNKEFFYLEDQKFLKEQFDILVNKGCYVIQTNSSAEFIKDLYKSYHIIDVQTKRLISSNSATRSGVDSIIVGKYA